MNILIGNMVKDPDRRTPEYKAGLKDCINNNGNKLDGQTFELGNNAKTLYWKGFKQAERDIKAEKEFKESEEFRKQLGIK